MNVFNQIHSKERLVQFVAQEIDLQNKYEITINDSLRLLIFDTELLGERKVEEMGKFYLFPIEDGRFYVELWYFYIDSESNEDRIYCLRYFPEFFDQYTQTALLSQMPFSFDQTSEMQFPICQISIQLLEQLRFSLDASDIIHLLHQQQRAISLLARALECILVPFTVCQVPACRFLSQNGEREKIQEAVNYIDLHIEENVTIRDLARKVAINECYLKKGFKAITGKTIHDYRLSVRMERAQKMLTESGNTVTDVALALGFSSISHFSTAFKKYTGMKPCALLS